jgi:hypothetical protein
MVLLFSDGTFFGKRSRSRRWRPGKSQCPEQILPGLEQELGCDGPRALEEALTGYQFPPRRMPGPVARFTYGVTSKGRQIEDREHGRQMLPSVPEVVLQVVSLGFENIERFVLDLPSGPAGGGQFGDIVPPDIQIGDEAIAIGHFPAGIAEYQDLAFRNLTCARVQCDEIWAFCYAKQKNVTGAKAAPEGAGDGPGPRSTRIPSWSCHGWWATGLATRRGGSSTIWPSGS